MQIGISILIGFLFCYILSSYWGEYLYSKNHYLVNNYIIKVDGKRRDIRHSPHWDLIKIAWTDDNDQLLLKIQGHGDRQPHYNWLNDTWDAE